jgi:hypothetical protein
MLAVELPEQISGLAPRLAGAGVSGHGGSKQLMAQRTCHGNWPAKPISRQQTADNIQLSSFLEAVHVKIDALQWLCHALLILLQSGG